MNVYFFVNFMAVATTNGLYCELQDKSLQILVTLPPLAPAMIFQKLQDFWLWGIQLRDVLKQGSAISHWCKGIGSGLNKCLSDVKATILEGRK